MSQKLSINIPATKPPFQLNVELPGDVGDDLSLYFATASEEYKDLTLDELVTAILRDHFSRDRAFQAVRRAASGGSKRGRKKKVVDFTDDAEVSN
jgi:hypothetical protein